MRFTNFLCQQLVISLFLGPGCSPNPPAQAPVDAGFSVDGGFDGGLTPDGGAAPDGGLTPDGGKPLDGGLAMPKLLDPPPCPDVTGTFADVLDGCALGAGEAVVQQSGCTAQVSGLGQDVSVDVDGEGHFGPVTLTLDGGTRVCSGAFRSARLDVECAGGDVDAGTCTTALVANLDARRWRTPRPMLDLPTYAFVSLGATGAGEALLAFDLQFFSPPPYSSMALTTRFAGTWWLEPTRHESAVVPHDRLPIVTSGGGGQALLAWRAERIERDQVAESAKAFRRWKGGAWESPVVYSRTSGTTTGGDRVGVGMDATGDVYVAAYAGGLQLARFPADGAQVPDDSLTVPGGFDPLLAVSPRRTGGATVLYRIVEMLGNMAVGRLHAARFDAGRWRLLGRVGDLHSWLSVPSAAAAASGADVAVVVWLAPAAAAGASPPLYTARIVDGVVGAAQPLSPDDGAKHEGAVTVSDGPAAVLVAWRREQGTDKTIVSNTVTEAGVEPSAMQTLSSSASLLSVPQLALEADHGVAAWMVGDGAESCLRVARRVGGLWRGGETVECAVNLGLLSWAITVDEDAVATAVWGRHAPGGSTLWYARFE